MKSDDCLYISDIFGDVWGSGMSRLGFAGTPDDKFSWSRGTKNIQKLAILTKTGEKSEHPVASFQDE
ncbi:uncharacterized protein APUU_70929A [Aspergillus puulaauensis]|uniref:Uncharacterized protein n=1 Tax=Aspergillus puulaauensis TaxID=1220207 RepID=A0A7R7XXI6_9EURO|nr:uncharacterized protein APUU_70929A [Aspergillus puulaauensis]BCS29359.1 hypothetical protein APUU_70929A [Aspergillus puulaauensis]